MKGYDERVIRDASVVNSTRHGMDNVAQTIHNSHANLTSHYHLASIIERRPAIPDTKVLNLEPEPTTEVVKNQV